MKKAFYLYAKAAEQGFDEAQYRLAKMYEEGRGIVQFPRFREAFYWYRRAAEQGHAEALSRLTNMVCRGEGTEEDIERTIHYREGN